MTASELNALLQRVQTATGRDHQLDKDIAHKFGLGGTKQPIPEYTASIDLCLALIEEVLPAWRWHIGYGPRGIFPYVSISNNGTRFEFQCTTIPLALLMALIQAKLWEAEN